MNARVAIGVPVYNGEKYLRAALASIATQTYENFEVLISDNGSTDRSLEIASEFCSADRRFRLHQQPQNLGASSNFNYVAEQTAAPLFRWHAHDDLIAPEYLEACVQALSDQPDAVLAHPQVAMIDADGALLRTYDAATRRCAGGPASRLDALIGPGDHSQSLLHYCFPVFGLIRRSALNRTRLIANMPRSDHLLLVQLALAGPFAEVSQPLFLRREHDSGSVIAAETAASGPEVERRLANWFDPSRGSRFPATTTRLGAGYVSAVLRAELEVAERARCLNIALGWCARHTRIIGGEIKIVLAERLSQGRSAGER